MNGPKKPISRPEQLELATAWSSRQPDVLDMGVAPGKNLDLDRTTREQAMADLVAEGIYSNAALVRRFGEQTLPTALGITESIVALRATVVQVRAGDLSCADTVLTSQALALNTIFGTLAVFAESNIRHNVEAADRYMRLALKAQAQSARTLEVLAAIKNPPTVFARQANIAHGPQQVNNGPARAGNSETAQTGLLEADDGERVDYRAEAAAGGADPHLATMGQVNGTEDR